MQCSGAIEAVASLGGAVSQVIYFQDIAAVRAVMAFVSIEHDRKLRKAARYLSQSMRRSSSFGRAGSERS